MADTPYDPPRTALVDPDNRLESARRRVHAAWIAGVAWGVLKLLAIVVPSSTQLHPLPPRSIAVAAAVTLGLSYGIFRRSRACAGILFALLSLGMIRGFALTWDAAVLLVVLVLVGFGVHGTYTLHEAARRQHHGAGTANQGTNESGPVPGSPEDVDRRDNPPRG